MKKKKKKLIEETIYRRERTTLANQAPNSDSVTTQVCVRTYTLHATVLVAVVISNVTVSTLLRDIDDALVRTNI